VWVESTVQRAAKALTTVLLARLLLLSFLFRFDIQNSDHFVKERRH
jgi:hypothetical protein